jgi:uncharacterized membrane protein
MNIVKIAGIFGTALGIAGTILSSWATQKATDQAITKKVAEAFAEQIKQ